MEWADLSPGQAGQDYDLNCLGQGSGGAHAEMVEGKSGWRHTSTSRMITFKIHKKLCFKCHLLSHVEKENQAGIIRGNVFLEDTFLDQIGTHRQQPHIQDDFSMFLPARLEHEMRRCG